jgi:hypothetical protein
MLIVAGRGGRISYSTDGSTFTNFGSYGTLTGALGFTKAALYKDSGKTNRSYKDWVNGKASSPPPDLLLVGVTGDETYEYGYFEIVINDNKLSNSHAPGSEYAALGTSISCDNGTYEATLETKPINSIMQAPDTDAGTGEPIIFASTQKDGVYSYRGGQWNAED